MATAAVVLLTGFGTGGPAVADTGLASASPSAGSRVAVAPKVVRLTFTQPVVGGHRYRVEVTGPDGANWAEDLVGVDENVVTAPLRPLRPTGEYLVRYQVEPGGRQPLTGEYRFALAPAVTEDLPGWLWPAGLVLLLGVGAAVLLPRTARR